MSQIEPTPEPPSKLPEPKEDKAKESSFFSGIVEWLGTLITEQARQENDILSKKYDFSLAKDHHEKIAESAKQIQEELELVKGRLIQEFGQQTAGFITKCVDPMIAHVTELVDGLSQTEKRDEVSSDFLNYAVECVRYYSALDEGKLKRKIVQDASKLVAQAIEKDVEILTNYKNHHIKESARQDEVNRILQPIILELKEMASAAIETDDLHDFFVWKTSIDEKRTTLVEMGFFIVDSLVGIVIKEKEITEN